MLYFYFPETTIYGLTAPGNPANRAPVQPADPGFRSRGAEILV